MITVKEYRGHIRNWEELCERLGIDLSLSREEREKEILIKAYQTWGYEMLRKKAEMRKNELESRGIRATVFCEEPFEAVRDSVDLKVYLMIWKRGTFNRKVRIEEII